MAEQCDDDAVVRVRVNLGYVTLDDLPSLIGRIEATAATVNAPKTAVVKLETNMVSVRGSSGPTTEAVIEFSVEPTPPRVRRAR